MWRPADQPSKAKKKNLLYTVFENVFKKELWTKIPTFQYLKFPKFSFSKKDVLIKNSHFANFYKINIVKFSVLQSSHFQMLQIVDLKYEVGLSNTVICNKQSFVVVVDRKGLLSAFPIFSIPNWKEKWDLSMVKRGIFGNFQSV